MRILLDNCVNQRFANRLPGHDVVHARKMGWEELSNGALIAAAEEAGFAAMITVDKNVRYQQNLVGRKLTIVVLDVRRITIGHLTPLAPEVLKALDELLPGAFVELRP